jgi:5,5'-dehydrodivanillate O-demethylase oxygenase subunit
MDTIDGRNGGGPEDPRDFVHTGPGTLAGRYLRRFWQPVMVADELKAGRAVPLRVMSEDFTLYRGEDGKLHAVGHRCPHRGTQLSVGKIEGDCIRCLYHGWKFDPTGQCVEQPGEIGDGFAYKVRIRSYPAEEYLGLIFVHMGEGEPPPMPRYREIEGEGHLESHWYTRACNYFQNIENSVDEVHVGFTHEISIFTTANLNRGVPTIAAEETDYGLVLHATQPDGIARVTHFIMPNILNMQLPPAVEEEKAWSQYISWRVPIDDLTHKSFISQRLRMSDEGMARYRARGAERRARVAAARSVDDVTADVLAGKLSIRDVADHPGIVGIQDNVSQIGQGIVANRNDEWLGRSDVAIILLRKLWRRELAALASGGPLKAWAVRGTLLESPGV